MKKQFTQTTGWYSPKGFRFNSGFAKKRFQWLIEHSTSHQFLWLIESFVHRNPPLRQAPNRQL
jgi:hypothetical protein